MTTNDSTFDITPPYRPGLSDFNGAAKVDDAEFPPDPTTMPNASELNTLERLAIAMGKVMPVCVLTIRFNAGVPAIDTFSSARSALALADFEVDDLGTGDTYVEWPAGSFPTAVVGAFACLTGATVGMIACEASANGIRVRTQDSGGSPQNFTWTALIF